MKTGAIIQARMGSTRLPGKVMKEVLGRPLLLYMLERVRRADKINEVIVATSDLSRDGPIAELAAANGTDVFRGSETDVLDRYFRAAEARGLDYIVRLTADCPLLDWPTINWFVALFLARAELDYLGTGPTFPEGYGMEILKFSALERAWREAVLPSEREHVTEYIWSRPHEFVVDRADFPHGDCSWVRITVDEQVDFEVVREIIGRFYEDKPDFGIEDIIDFLKNERPDLVAKNRRTARSEGYLRRTSVDPVSGADGRGRHGNS